MHEHWLDLNIHDWFTSNTIDQKTLKSADPESCRPDKYFLKPNWTKKNNNLIRAIGWSWTRSLLLKLMNIPNSDSNIYLRKNKIFIRWSNISKTNGIIARYEHDLSSQILEKKQNIYKMIKVCNKRMLLLCACIGWLHLKMSTSIKWKNKPWNRCSFKSTILFRWLGETINAVTQQFFSSKKLMWHTDSCM